MNRNVLPFLLVVFLAAFSSCDKGGDFRHSGHLTATRGECAPCHGTDPAAPRMPAVEDCAACHKEAKSLDPAQAGKYAAKKAEGPRARPAGYADVRFDHRPHAEAKIACSACHLPATRAGAKISFPAMSECTSCHAKEGVSKDCSACHAKLRKTSPPPSHGSGWEIRHGAASRFAGETCAYCHEDRSCNACHAEKKPRSHVGGWDKSAHGLRAVEDRTACAVCHEAGFCNRCHQVPPPSHFVPNFRFQAHRNAARFNPRSCAVCHERSFCLACHPSS